MHRLLHRRRMRMFRRRVTRQREQAGPTFPSGLKYPIQLTLYPLLSLFFPPSPRASFAVLYRFSLQSNCRTAQLFFFPSVLRFNFDFEYQNSARSLHQSRYNVSRTLSFQVVQTGIRGWTKLGDPWLSSISKSVKDYATLVVACERGSRRVNGLCNRQSRPSNLFIDERIAAERIFRTFLVGFRIVKHGPFPCRIPSRPFLVSSLLILARIPWKKLASIVYCRNSGSTRRYWQVSVRRCVFSQIFALFCKTLSENERRYTANYDAVHYEFEEARVSRNIWKRKSERNRCRLKFRENQDEIPGLSRSHESGGGAIFPRYNFRRAGSISLSPNTSNDQLAAGINRPTGRWTVVEPVIVKSSLPDFAFDSESTICKLVA